MADEPRYYFAPCHPLQNITVPQELIDLCGGPEQFLEIQRELRNTPMNELPTEVVNALHEEIKRLESERK